MQTGQLGGGDCEPKCEPTPVDALRNVAVRRVVCGSNTTFVLSQSGALYACGAGQQGQVLPLRVR
jgi:alpha-tubulin suppressor-like RCC1 family protein